MQSSVSIVFNTTFKTFSIRTILDETLCSTCRQNFNVNDIFKEFRKNSYNLDAYFSPGTMRTNARVYSFAEYIN